MTIELECSFFLHRVDGKACCVISRDDVRFFTRFVPKNSLRDFLYLRRSKEHDKIREDAKIGDQGWIKYFNPNEKTGSSYFNYEHREFLVDEDDDYNATRRCFDVHVDDSTVPDEEEKDFPEEWLTSNPSVQCRDFEIFDGSKNVAISVDELEEKVKTIAERVVSKKSRMVPDMRAGMKTNPYKRPADGQKGRGYCKHHLPKKDEDVGKEREGDEKTTTGEGDEEDE